MRSPSRFVVLAILEAPSMRFGYVRNWVERAHWDQWERGPAEVTIPVDDGDHQEME